MSKLFLAIESSTKMCSVALFDGSKLLDHIEEGGDYSHAEKLAPFVDQLLTRNELKTTDLKAVAISSGPGSYTGLRIGLSLAKGICFASDLPLISISTLKAMANGAKKVMNESDAIYAPMIDARRMEVYTELFDYELNSIEEVSAKVIDEQSFQDLKERKKLLYFGDGALKCKEVLDPAFTYLENDFISATHWGELILEKFDNEQFEDLAYYEPFYYKSFVAGKPKSLL